MEQANPCCHTYPFECDEQEQISWLALFRFVTLVAVDTEESPEIS